MSGPGMMKSRPGQMQPRRHLLYEPRDTAPDLPAAFNKIFQLDEGFSHQSPGARCLHQAIAMALKGQCCHTRQM